MARQHSDVERANLAWFARDDSRASLKSIEVLSGEIRGLRSLKVDFNYPISAIAGKNGCGKTTLLALSACAFHNAEKGWSLPDRPLPYYRFSDFFIQAEGEVPVEGIAIRYGILFDNWRRSERFPEGKGLGYQLREKKKKGKWTDYAGRVERPVAFFGIERVVPPAEKSVFRNYRNLFQGKDREGNEERVKSLVSRVFLVCSMTTLRLGRMENIDCHGFLEVGQTTPDSIWGQARKRYLS